MEIWNEYVIARKQEKVSDDIFVTKMNCEEVWVIKDGAAFTILYPEDY